MKKKLFTAIAVTLSAIAFSQNSNPWPTTGNVGIGTSSPSVKLDVVLQSELATTNPYNFAYFGTKIGSMTLPVTYSYKGLYIQEQNFTSIGEYMMRLQSIYPGSRVNSNVNAGYIEFNPITTANTTRGAVNFGYSGTELMRINQNGKVRIGSDIPTPDGYKLFVEQGILTEKVKVAFRNGSDWADYVFDPGYELMPLKDVEQHLIKHKHLPNFPSANDMVNNGLDVAKMDAKLLEKIEELTLYLIEQQKQIDALKTELQQIKGHK